MNVRIALLVGMISSMCGAMHLRLINRTSKSIGVEFELKTYELIDRFALLQDGIHTCAAEDLKGSIVRIFIVLDSQDSSNSLQWRKNNIEGGFIVFKSEDLEIQEDDKRIKIRKVIK